MAKYEDQLERMNFLMEYKAQAPKSDSGSIWYHANGADGKVYGIIKEGTKFYIKTTESGKENLSESYDYINGFNNRRENEFTDYNKATKKLELELMHLNEQFGKHEASSTVDFKRSEKVFANLTEAARVEIDRMNQIFENSCKIGSGCACFEDPESKGKSTGDNTKENNDPFTQSANADMDYKGSNGTVKGATDGTEVKDINADLQSDKMKTKNSGSEKDYKPAHDDLDGEGAADKKLNEGFYPDENTNVYDNNGADAMAAMGADDEGSEEIDEVEFPDENPNTFDDGGAAAMDAMSAEDFEDPMIPDGDLSDDDFADNAEVGDDIAGQGDDEDLDSLLEAFEAEFCNEENETTSKITGPDPVMDKEKNPINGTNNGIGDEKGEEWKRIDEEDGNVNEPTKQGDEDTMKNYQSKGSLPVQSWDKMDKSVIRKITEDVCRKLTHKESLNEKIDRMVREEITKLDAWGKHPRYRKEPMTTPSNKEVLAGTAEKDWNDDSAKGDQPYGQKIGDGAPFNQKIVDMLTDQVMAQLKENFAK